MPANFSSFSKAVDSFVGVSGSLGYVTILLTVLAGYALKQAIFYPPEAPVDMTKKEEEEDTSPVRNFTAQQLLEFDGKPDEDGNDKPVYLSVKGIVFDMSSGRNFYGPGGPYENFAGHECGVALAKMSFDTQHLDDLDGCSKLNFGEKTELDGWIEKFQYYRNYPIMGRLVTNLPNKEWILDEMVKANQETPEGYASCPIYIAAKGKVFDMSFGGAEFYGKGGPYSKFAGKDVSRALATMSLDQAEIDNPDITKLEDKQIKVLDDWVRKFEKSKCYPIVGTLKK